MSVRGEFQRYVADCQTLLETAAVDAGPWEEALRGAAERAAENLSGAAEGVLSGCERLRERPPGFRAVAEGERFAGLVERLEAICRVILGR